MNQGPALASTTSIAGIVTMTTRPNRLFPEKDKPFVSEISLFVSGDFSVAVFLVVYYNRWPSFLEP